MRSVCALPVVTQGRRVLKMLVSRTVAARRHRDSDILRTYTVMVVLSDSQRQPIPYGR